MSLLTRWAPVPEPEATAEESARAIAEARQRALTARRAVRGSGGTSGTGTASEARTEPLRASQGPQRLGGGGAGITRDQTTPGGRALVTPPGSYARTPPSRALTHAPRARVRLAWADALALVGRGHGCGGA